MSAQHSISQWIAAWREGDQRAAHELWRRYYQRAAGVARRRVRYLPHGDEEDVAAQALHSLLQRTRRGNLDHVGSRDDFWRLLMTITERKAIDQYRRAYRSKRGGSASVVSLRYLNEPLTGRADRGQSPVDLASFNETLQQLLAGLDAELRQIVELKIAGYTNVEIAARVHRSVPTIERRLRLIRESWMEEAAPCPAE